MLLHIFFSVFAFAEYRAFKLEITNEDTGTSRIVISNLDAYQYPGYYPLKPTEQIHQIQTWRCFGRTDYMTPYCPAPELPEENPTPEQKLDPVPTTKDLSKP